MAAPVGGSRTLCACSDRGTTIRGTDISGVSGSHSLIQQPPASGDGEGPRGHSSPPATAAAAAAIAGASAAGASTCAAAAVGGDCADGWDAGGGAAVGGDGSVGAAGRELD